MLVTEFGMIISCNDMHPKNASFPMLVTVFGMVISRNAPRNLNASLQMTFVPSFILYWLTLAPFNNLFPSLHTLRRIHLLQLRPNLHP